MASAAQGLEQALDDLRGAPQPGRRKLRVFYAKVLEARDGQHHEPNELIAEELFRQESGRDAERHVALALLHLLSAAPGAFSDASLAGRAENLWDEHLSDIYRLLGVGANAHAFDKRQALMDAIPRAERALNDVIDDAVSVRNSRGLRSLREQYTKALRGQWQLVGLFLPPTLTRARLDEVFESVQSVFDASDLTLVGASQQCWTVLRRFRDDAEQFGTSYARRFLAALADGLLQCVEAYRAERTLEPADLRLTPGYKKYPLRENGRQIRVALCIENRGQGPALDTIVVLDAVAGIVVADAEIFAGTVRTGMQVLEVDAQVDCADLVQGAAEVIGQLKWRNADGSPGAAALELVIEPQPGDVDWTAVRGRTPYRLSAISDPHELIGRDQLIDHLTSALANDDMASCTISGQKRVGKTSIVKSLDTRLAAEAPQVLVCYLQVGPFKTKAGALYREIARVVIQAGQRQAPHRPEWEVLSPPDFSDGFSDLLGVVDKVLDIGGAVRLVLVLDEFDEIPARLYQHNDEAGAFFNTLRELTARDRTSVILVGGENLAFVLTVNGSALNMLESHRVDSFRRNDQFVDFAELVRRPSQGILDFEPEAIETLYDESAGHPYFAKMICQSLFALMTERRDSSVTAAEVREAVHQALAKASPTAFAHFWDDGIFEVEPGRKQEVARARRLTLLSVSRALRAAEGPTREQIDTEASRIALPAVDLAQALRSFEQRGVLAIAGDCVEPRIPFFRRWLRDHGAANIVSEITDEAARDRLQVHLDEAAVTGAEIAELVGGWGLYRNRDITTDAVRAWLEQFGGALEQRRALDLIKQLHFVDGKEIRGAFSSAHQRLTAGRTRLLATGQQRFTDVLVVPFDDPGSSGYTYGATYVTANNIHRANIVARESLASRLRNTRRDVGMVVFVDDFIATGGTAISRLGELGDASYERLRDRSLLAALVVMAGFEDGIRAVEQWLAAEDLPILVDAQQVLDRRDRVFGQGSRFFPKASERVATEKLFENVGPVTAAERPAGWLATQSLVVFEANVPNSTLPHLWQERSGPAPWIPLFERF